MVPRNESNKTHVDIYEEQCKDLLKTKVNEVINHVHDQEETIL